LGAAAFTQNFWADCQLGSSGELIIPKIVMLLLIGLLLFFFYATGKLWWSSSRYQRRLRYLIGALKGEAANPGAIGPAGVNRIGEFLSEDALCKHGWGEFRETLITDTSGPEDLTYNTKQAEELFSEEEIVSACMHPGFFRAVPGVLTSLGLLGTFIAILIGLHGIEVYPGQKIEGIDKFVNALSGKFASSVVALALAIGFTLLQTREFHRAHQTYRKFCQALDAVFPRRTAEAVLSTMRTDIREQRAAFEHFNTDLSARFRDGVTEGLGPILMKLNKTLESLSTQRDGNIEVLMERLSGEFRSSMTQSAGIEFNQIATAVEQASQLMARTNEQTTHTQKSFDQLIAAMNQSATQQAHRTEASLGKIATSMDESIAKQKQASTQQAETTAELLRQMIESLGRASSQSQSALEARVRELMETTGSFSERVTRELQAVLAEHRGAVGSLSEMQTAFGRNVELWNQGTDQLQRIVTPLREATKGIEATSSSLQGTAADIRKAQHELGELFAGAQRELSRLAEMGSTNERVLGEHRRVFETVQSGLGPLLTTITNKIEALQEVSARGLTHQLQEFDNHLGTATKKLGASVDELGEILDDAAGKMRGVSRLQ
jgi:ABC-type transporter Mla subunit MlaD